MSRTSIYNEPVNNQQLSQVQPVNQPKKKKTPKTTKQQAKDKHQTISRTADKTADFGSHKYTRDEIESQFLKGLGGYAPSNKSGLSIPELQAKYEKLSAKFGAQPAKTTPYEVLGDLQKAPSPATHYGRYTTGGRNLGDMNNIELASGLAGEPTVRVSIKNLGAAIWRKITEGRMFERERAQAFVDYLRELADTLEKGIAKGEQYNRRQIQWDRHKNDLGKAQKLLQEQTDWELSLTDMDRRAIEQDRTLGAISGDVSALVAQEVAKVLEAQKEAENGLQEGK